MIIIIIKTLYTYMFFALSMKVKTCFGASPTCPRLSRTVFKDLRISFSAKGKATPETSLRFCQRMKKICSQKLEKMVFGSLFSII